MIARAVFHGLSDRKSFSLPPAGPEQVCCYPDSDTRRGASFQWPAFFKDTVWGVSCQCTASGQLLFRDTVWGCVHNGAGPVVPLSSLNLNCHGAKMSGVIGPARGAGYQLACAIRHHLADAQ